MNIETDIGGCNSSRQASTDRGQHPHSPCSLNQHKAPAFLLLLPFTTCDDVQMQ